LVQVAVHVAARVRRRRAKSREDFDEAVEDTSDTGAANAEDHLDRERALGLLARVLDGMDDDVRDVFVLHEIEEMTMAEIATTLALAPRHGCFASSSRPRAVRAQRRACATRGRAMTEARRVLETDPTSFGASLLRAAKEYTPPRAAHAGILVAVGLSATDRLAALKAFATSKLGFAIFALAGTAASDASVYGSQRPGAREAAGLVARAPSSASSAPLLEGLRKLVVGEEAPSTTTKPRARPAPRASTSRPAMHDDEETLAEELAAIDAARAAQRIEVLAAAGQTGEAHRRAERSSGSSRGASSRGARASCSRARAESCESGQFRRTRRRSLRVREDVTLAACVGGFCCRAPSG